MRWLASQGITELWVMNITNLTKNCQYNPKLAITASFLNSAWGSFPFSTSSSHGDTQVSNFDNFLGGMLVSHLCLIAFKNNFIISFSSYICLLTHSLIRFLLTLPWWFRWEQICLQCRRPGYQSQLEDPLEKGTATHSSILAWRISWTEEPGSRL